MDTLHIDHLGPFVTSSQRNKYLLVVIDALTKYVFLGPAPNTKTEPAIKFLDRIINAYGAPCRIIADRGTAFTSQKFRNYCATLGIKLVLTATATPRGNGQCERVNATILNRLATLIDDEYHWDRYLEQIRFAINNTTNRVTGFTPHELLMNYTPRPRNTAFLLNLLSTMEPDAQTAREKRAIAERRITEVQRKEQAKDARKRHFTKTFKEGDQVLIKYHAPPDGTSRKLRPRFKGPFFISERVGNRYRVINCPRERKYEGIHPVEHLRLYATKRDTSHDDDSSSTSDSKT